MVLGLSVGRLHRAGRSSHRAAPITWTFPVARDRQALAGPCTKGAAASCLFFFDETPKLSTVGGFSAGRRRGATVPDFPVGALGVPRRLLPTPRARRPRCTAPTRVGRGVP